MTRHRNCPFCLKDYVPHPRLGKRQKTCGRPDCKRKQNRLCQKDWKRKNRDACRENQKNWRDANPDYWQNYRKQHPSYTLRNRAQSRWRKRMSRLGLQRKLDILEVHVNSMEFWNLPRFAKYTRSLTPLLCAYASRHEQISRRTQYPPL